MDRSNKMLIDASHPEETRVVVLKNGRVEEFDFESAARKLLRGNIYLAKITRVEPSLQAAFVEYGGNRHGFLAFNEIHPDYYQIPVADREALKEEEAREEAREEDEAEARAQRRGRRGRGRDRGDSARGRHDGHEEAGGNGDGRDSADDQHPYDPDSGHGEGTSPREVALSHPEDDRLVSPVDDRDPERASHEASDITDAPDPIGNVEDQGIVEINGDGDDPETVEEVATEEDAYEEVPERPRRRMRQYKIQEVIKRRQVVLIQVVKEERGTKGAALTTYISLAGRYTVLMPNTGRGGGISRKITQPQDRKRLKAIAEDLDVTEGMGLIIRTAGASRTKQEIKRDYEYLLRLWESVRDLTFASTAPALVYEEGNLIKRAIRDLYSKDVDGVVVSGEIAHREARDFMSMLMPGNADHVARYDGSEPLFTRYGIERQLNAFFSPYVNLRSGGYLVINQTEALVSVDVNSGKSTREFSIEETAINTNLEAAEELARQLRLRDLAGLIVVDFIDMEEKRNNRSVERRLKDALRHDRARIQVGRISHFGLLEMSRQRLRTGMLEGSTSQCPHCQGTGIIRSVESVSLAVLRGLEDNLMKQPSSLAAVTTAEVALYILNHKRHFINDMERRHGITITVDSSDRMQGANFAIERTAAPVAAPKVEGPRHAVSLESGFNGDDGPAYEEDDRDAGRTRVEPIHDDRDTRDDGDDDDRGDGESRDIRATRDDEQGEERGGKRRRRRRRGRRDREGGPEGGDREIEQRDEPAYADVRDRDREDGEPARDADRNQDPEPRDVRDDVVAIDRDDADVRGEEANDPNAGQDEQGDRQRRGRRRGRRGGRGRGRDERPSVTTTDAGDWGVTELARPGADQPEGPAATVARGWDDGYVPAAQGPSTANDGLGAATAEHAAVQTLPPVPAPPRQFPRAEPLTLASVTTADVIRSTPHEEPAPAAMPPPQPRAEAPEVPAGPARKGWWQRRFGG